MGNKNKYSRTSACKRFIFPSFEKVGYLFIRFIATHLLYLEGSVIFGGMVLKPVFLL
jgi:hypothetical protein